MAPKLSPNPGKTARHYRKNKASRDKHRADENARGKTPAKKAYRAELGRARRKAKPGAQQDMSHKGGKITPESRKTNRARGGSKRK
tara:strand:- start:1815 stop:2072 length:258 start_codon:yes stop_codon:yes gene_type:complete